MKNFYFYHSKNKRKVLSEEDAFKKKLLISKNAKKLRTVEAVVAFCTENYILGPMTETNAKLLCEQKK